MSKITRYLSIGLLVLTGWTAAKELTSDSEQFYVVQGMFEALGIEAVSCSIEDSLLEFACGIHNEDINLVQAGVNAYIARDLPGLYMVRDWFQNDQGRVRVYTSTQGTYYISLNSDASVVVAFVPRS